MDFLRKWWAQIRLTMSQLTLSARFAIALCFVLLLVVLGVVLLYASLPDYEPLPIYASDRQAEIMVHLDQAGIRVAERAGRMMVPAAERDRAFAVLAEHELLGGDTAAAFDEIIARQNLWDSSEKTQQNLLLAKQKVLAQVIRKMRSIRGADVMISLPRHEGFGAPTRSASASVSVVMQQGKSIDNRLVEAIAGLVAGAVAEMTPADVTVVDANNGRSFTVRDDASNATSDSIELVQTLERRYHDKIRDALAYIPGVIVAVNVRVDKVRSERVEKVDYEKSEPLRETTTRERTRSQTQSAGEAGARPNTGLSIETGGGAGSSESETEERTLFGEKNVVQRVQQVLAGQNTQRINVTINVPRRYFLSLFMAGKPAETPTPDDAALAAVVAPQLAQIKAQVEPLIDAQETGVVIAHMVPDAEQLLGAAQASAGSGLFVMLGGDYARPALLGGLAVVSLGLMLLMVRRASTQPHLPTAEELAGLPPTLPGEDDLVGEAEESDLGMAGVELGEEEIRSRKIAEQISELVKANPAEAANLIKKWVRTED